MDGDPEPFVELAGEEWRAAASAAPREHFIPDRAYASWLAGGRAWVDRAADPEAWRAAVYADTTIVTQLDDGNVPLTPETASKSVPTSSCTAPSLVFEFLRLLDPYPGDQVLEIGTGTGWTAALLSAKLGAGHVTSIEVDEQVAKQAAANLARAGCSPNLVVGDGAVGWPEDAPFDRVHVTAGVREVSYAWVEQTRPGGVIVLPWAPNQAAGHRLALTVTGKGTAVGRLSGSAAFMPLRDQRFTTPAPEGAERDTEPRIDPRRLTADPGFPAAMAGLLPGVSLMELRHRGDHRVVLRSPDSYATTRRPDGPGEAAIASQSGPRDLWTEVEAAYLTWVGWGCPTRERFGVTVTADGQRVWLDGPDNPLKE